jgi:hypothetical protein
VETVCSVEHVPTHSSPRRATCGVVPNPASRPCRGRGGGQRPHSPAWTLAALSRQFCLGRLELVAPRGELERNHVTGPQIPAASCCFLVTGCARPRCCKALAMAEARFCEFVT